MRLTEFVFKCIKGYTVKEFKELIVCTEELIQTPFFQDQKRILLETPYDFEVQ